MLLGIGFPPMMRRILIAVVIGFALVVGGGYALRGPIFDAAGEKALDKVSRRLGMPVVAASVQHDGWTAIRFKSLVVGPVSAPLVTAEEVRGTLDRSALRRAKIVPSAVLVTRPTIHVYGDGTLEGALRAAKDALPTFGGGDGPADGPRRARPALTIRDGRVVDKGGAIAVQALDMTFIEGELAGKFVATEPAVGPCTFSGTTKALKVSCESGVKKSLPGGLIAGGKTLEIEREPKLTIRLPDLKVERADGPISELLPSLRADLTVGLDRDEKGRWPIKARLPLPGGGDVVADGFADLNGLAMSANVTNLKVGPAHEAIDGSLSGTARLTIDRQKRTLRLEGDGKLKRFKVVHPALAEGPIGPFDLEIGGKLSVDVEAGRPMSAIKAKIENGRFVLGTVVMNITASLDNTGEAPIIKANFDVPKVNGSRLSAAIPPGLMPHLQPLQFDGEFSFDGLVELDMSDIKNMKLVANPNLRQLTVEEMNVDINFNRLKRTFRTRFEMPDGQMFVRTTGPNTARWTSLESIPQLLPAAVVAQEDGGFYRHRGVSMLHLRGSLIRNLERGRFARGGSTLTMQLARNLFLHRKKTLARKLEELIIAWQLESKFGKDMLMALYLNVVEFGPGIFGIGDASRHFFEKDPSELDAVQIAYITRLLPSPRTFYWQYEKKKLSNRYATRMAALLRRLVKRKKMTQAHYDSLSIDAVWTKDQRQRDLYLGADGVPVDDEDEDDPLDDDDDASGVLDDIDQP